MTSKLWTDKYSPTNLSQIIGNKTNISKMKMWIQNIKRRKTHTPILFLYGPSGVGKTRLAHLLLQEYQYPVLEFNAGEIRSRKRIEEIVQKLFYHHSVNDKKIGIIMDEIDGMSCGDKGGLHFLLEFILQYYHPHNSKSIISYHPIICISNRPLEKKTQSSLCLELKVNRMLGHELLGYLQSICLCENFEVSDAILRDIVQFSKHDIRKSIIILQDLQTIQSHHHHDDHELSMETYLSIKHSFLSQVSDKNLFDMTQLFYTCPLNFSSILSYCQIDPNLLPSMIFDNFSIQLPRLKQSIPQILDYYYELTYKFMIADVIEKNIYSQASRYEIQPFSHLLKCFPVNHIFGSKHSSLKIQITDIIFTNSLSRSATQMNNMSFLIQVSSITDIPLKELCPESQLLHLYIQQPSSSHLVHPYIHPSLRKLSFTELEKILQLYSLHEDKKMTIRQKKILKDLLSSS